LETYYLYSEALLDIFGVPEEVRKQLRAGGFEDRSLDDVLKTVGKKATGGRFGSAHLVLNIKYWDEQSIPFVAFDVGGDTWYQRVFTADWTDDAGQKHSVPVGAIVWDNLNEFLNYWKFRQDIKGATSYMIHIFSFAASTVGADAALLARPGRGFSLPKFRSSKIPNNTQVPDAPKNIKHGADLVDDIVGQGAKGTLNDAGDLVIESANGLKKVRFDINHTAPHKNPHGHVELFKKVKNNKVPVKKSGPIYPRDVPHE
jgi:hypothetical protein